MDLGLAPLALVFLLYYCAAMFPRFGAHYASNRKMPVLEVLGTYLALDVLIWILILVWTARCYFILRGKVTASTLWDGVALGGICYFAGYIILGMESAYYLAPVDVIAILYVGRFAFLSIPKLGVAGRGAALALLLLVCPRCSSFVTSIV